MRHIGIVLLSLCAIAGAPAWAAAEGSTQHSAAASKEAAKIAGHSARAAGHVIVGGAQAASASAAVPLMASGAVGKASGQSGKAMMDEAIGDGAPLPISDETVTAGPPPDDALASE